ncbi:tautomerase family protein [Terrisporobacter mayombei]|uniref:Tautomerase PptA n=1 Tax=Terrisporobacter mayombei TaxID=1541 RepID=A0ABY9PZT3_9FIRM|nr:tautomerase family protein [Terrisporobacter mayombei]MCC3868402.1 tautomerase family protein [Terrisporobacter mayombei]WMT80550.1 Tautomerase PptA [Terrisporobacter mayombei]
MPHINIKMYPGRSEEVKAKLAKHTKEFMVKELEMDEKFISVSVEEIDKENWQSEVMDKIKEEELYERPNF